MNSDVYIFDAKFSFILDTTICLWIALDYCFVVGSSPHDLGRNLYIETELLNVWQMRSI